MIRVLRLIVCLAALPLDLASAQTATSRADPDHLPIEDGRQELRLETVLASMREHHPIIASERAGVRAAQAETLAARGEFDTVLSIQGRAAPLGYYDARRMDVVLEQPTPLLGTSLYAGYRISGGNVAPYYAEQRTLDRGEVRGGIRMPLLQDLRIDSRRAGIKSANAQAEAQARSLDELLLDYERDAALAYVAWVAAGNRVGVLQALVDLAATRDEQIRGKVALGALAPIEQLDNRRSLLERQRQLVVAQRGFEKCGIDLSMFLRDRTGKPRVPVASELPRALKLSAPPLRDLRSAEATALTDRPELAAYRALQEASQVERDLAKNRVMPRLDTFAEVSKDFGSTHTLLPTLEPAVLEIGATLSLPLWLRKARGKLKAAEAKVDSAAEKTRFVQDKVLAEVRDAWSQLTAAENRASMALEVVEAAEKIADGERERFELGATTVLFVNIREQSAADARLALIDAHAELQYSAARLVTFVGQSLSP